MKNTIKYLLNIFGLMFVVIGLVCDLSYSWEAIFCIIGALMYITERQWSADDEQEQDDKIKKLEEKIEELKNKIGETK